MLWSDKWFCLEVNNEVLRCMHIGISELKSMSTVCLLTMEALGGMGRSLAKALVCCWETSVGPNCRAASQSKLGSSKLWILDKVLLEEAQE